MNAPTFTPGPWRVEERFADRQVVVLANINERVSVVVAAGGSSSIEQHANASLIAASPKLYAALNDLWTWVTEHRTGADVVPDGLGAQVIAALEEVQGR